MTIALIILALVLLFASSSYLVHQINEDKLTATPFIGIVLGLVALFLSAAIVIIPTGYIGVKTSLGQINPAPINSGMILKTPFIQSIKLVNYKLQDKTIKDKIWAETSSRTALAYENIMISYQIESSQSAWILANVMDYTNSLIPTTLVSSAIKSSSVGLTDIEATNRGKVEPLVMTALQQALDAKYGRTVVRIARISVGNVSFEDSYNKAIADKQKAQLAYEQQQITNKQAQEKAEADAKVKLTQSQNDAQTRVIQAEAAAKAKLISAQAEADSNKKIASSLTDDIFKQKYFEKWDGKLPVVNGSSSGSILDVSGLIK
jgi:regulator of protease activity HflC (stomatin/prohibitin superfamily)